MIDNFSREDIQFYRQHLVVEFDSTVLTDIHTKLLVLVSRGLKRGRKMHVHKKFLPHRHLFPKHTVMDVKMKWKRVKEALGFFFLPLTVPSTLSRD